MHSDQNCTYPIIYTDFHFFSVRQYHSQRSITRALVCAQRSLIEGQVYVWCLDTDGNKWGV